MAAAASRGEGRRDDDGRAGRRGYRPFWGAIERPANWYPPVSGVGVRLPFTHTFEATRADDEGPLGTFWRVDTQALDPTPVLTTVGIVSSFPFALVVSPKLPVDSLAAFVAPLSVTLS